MRYLGVGFTAAALFAQGDIESRYWRALNQGREVQRFEKIAEKLTFPALGFARDALLEREALRALEEIERLPPFPAVTNTAEKPEPVGLGADWPSMGGNPSHSGFTRDPGPARGEPSWRYPIGWDWTAPPVIHGDKVYTASPGSYDIMRCLERRTGKLLWTARRAPVKGDRRSKAASEVHLFAENQAAVLLHGPAGEIQELALVDTVKGRVLRLIPATPTEREFDAPGVVTGPWLAYRDPGRPGVTVKKLPSGRTWWRFAAGRLCSEPVATDGMVFAATDDGTVWALHAEGENRVAWTYSAGSPVCCRPAVAEGIVFAGSNDGRIYALDARSGALRWSTKISNGEPRAHRLFSTPAVSGGRVYVGAADGNLFALGARDGKLLWSASAGDWIRARPFVYRSTVIVCTVGGEVIAWRDSGQAARPLWRRQVSRHPVLADLAGDESGVLIAATDLTLTAVGLSDGSVQWRAPLVGIAPSDAGETLADAPPQWLQAPVSVAQGRVFAGGADHFVRAVDGLSGREIWRYETSGRVAAGPAYCSGMVFAGQYGGDETFVAIDARTGRAVWSRNLGWVWATPECEGNQVFVGTTSGAFYCLRAGSGEVLWSRRFGDGVYSAPAVAAKAVYTGSWDGHYYALDRETGGVLWAWSPPGWPYHKGGRPDSAAPVLAGGKVIVPALGSRFVALNAQSGRKEWEWTAPPWRIANATAAVSDDVVYVSVFGNAYELPFGARLFALDLATGKPLWDLPGIGGLTAPVITGRGLLLCGSLSNPFLSAYQLKSDSRLPPTLLWRFRTGGTMAESLPAVSGNLAFFLSNDGWLRAIR